MTFPANFKGAPCHETYLGVQFCFLLVGCRIYRCENSEFLWRLKLEACDYSSYLYLNELVGYVDLLNFHENWLNVLQILTHKIL